MKLPNAIRKLLLGRLKRVMHRSPDIQIGKANPKGPYLNRWYLIPRNKYFNIYLHEFLRDDNDEALHDHPWWSLSFLLQGHLQEQRQTNAKMHYIAEGSIVFRKAEFAHRLMIPITNDSNFFSKPLYSKRPITLFMTGPVIRPWGFHCLTGWVPWEKFIPRVDKGLSGCGED